MGLNSGGFETLKVFSMEKIAQNEISFLDLLVAIETSDKRLSLLLAVCDRDDLRASITERYERELAVENISAYRVTIDHQDPSLYAAINKLIDTEPYLQSVNPAVITVEGIVSLSDFATEGARSPLDTFLGYLQWTREGMRKFPFPIVIWVSERIHNEISRKAQDFYSWRQGVFFFEAEQEANIPISSQVTRQFIDSQFIDSQSDEDRDLDLPIDELLKYIAQREEEGKQDEDLVTFYKALANAYKRENQIDQEIATWQKVIALQQATPPSQNLNFNNVKGWQINTHGGTDHLGKNFYINQINQTGMQGVSAGGNINANIDQSVGKTVIYQAPKENQPIPSNVRQGSPNFVGRETELEQIHAKLQSGQGVIVCAVEGLGGVGKTELALQYAQHYKDEYVAQYWLQLRGIGLAQAVVTLANPYLALPESMQSASLDEQSAWYWLNWKPEEGRLLVILDDVPNAESIPDAAMPNDARVRVLVTTRERDLNLGFVSLPLDVLSKEKALALLRKIVGAVKVDRELAIVEQVCETLGYLPLAIELVGEYLVKNRHLTFAKLQENLRLADKVLSRDRKNKFYAYRGVEAAILLSWQDLSAAAQRVAMWLGLFAPVEIGWKLVADMAASAEITESELDEARGELDRLHLIQPVGEDCNFYKIHTLVREFFRDRLAQATENQLFRVAFVTSLLDVAKTIPRSPTRDLIANVAPAIPHLDLLSREMLDDIPNPEEDNNLAWAFTGIARFYQGQGLYASAIISFQNRLKIIESRLGEDHLYVAESINDLALVYQLQGRYDEAETLFVRLLDLIKRLCGDYDLHVAIAMNSLGYIYYLNKKNYIDSKRLLTQSLLLKKELLGERHIGVATTINNLGLVDLELGEYDEAESYLSEALYLRQELLGDKHSDVASSFHNLALLYQAKCNYKLAEDLFTKALILYKYLHGNQHPYVATSLNKLGEISYSQGKYSEAEQFYLGSLSIRQRQLGSNHPDVAISLNNLAALYNSQGRYEEAEPLYLEAIQLSRELLGDRHPDVATNLNNLAELYRSQGKYGEAELLYQESLQLMRESLGDRHPDIATSLNNLAELYRLQGRYEESEPFYLYAMQLSRELLGDRHPDIATSLNNLALLYKSQGRYEEAELLCIQALTLRQELLGDRHPSVATSLNNLGSLYELQGRYAEAEPLFQESLQLMRELLGNGHPSVATSLNNLALLYNSQGRYAEAEPLFQESLQLWRKILGNGHPSVAASLFNFAALYYNTQRYSEALQSIQLAIQIYQQTLGNEHPTTQSALNWLQAIQKAL